MADRLIRRAGRRPLLERNRRDSCSLFRPTNPLPLHTLVSNGTRNSSFSSSPGNTGRLSSP